MKFKDKASLDAARMDAYNRKQELLNKGQLGQELDVVNNEIEMLNSASYGKERDMVKELADSRARRDALESNPTLDKNRENFMKVGEIMENMVGLERVNATRYIQEHGYDKFIKKHTYNAPVEPATTPASNEKRTYKNVKELLANNVISLDDIESGRVNTTNLQMYLDGDLG